MVEIERSALLPYSAEQIYTLINDVGAYPAYLDGCIGADILAQTEAEMTARLHLAKAGFNYSFTTRNRLQPPHRVDMTLVDGPFETFAGHWAIRPLSPQACKVILSLQFSLNSKVLALATKTLFKPMADNLVEAIVKRAHALYNPGSASKDILL